MEEQEEEDEDEDEDEDEEKVTNQPGTARRPKQPAARHPTEVSPPKKRCTDRILDGKRSGKEKTDEPVAKQDKNTWKKMACKHRPDGVIA